MKQKQIFLKFVAISSFLIFIPLASAGAQSCARPYDCTKGSGYWNEDWSCINNQCQTAKCGDGYCNDCEFSPCGPRMETSTNCPADCKSAPATPPATPQFTETDSGKDYYVKGAVTGYDAFAEKIEKNIVTKEDRCASNCIGVAETGASTDGTCLTEYYLDSDKYANHETVACENGCENGACKKDPCENNEDVLPAVTPPTKIPVTDVSDLEMTENDDGVVSLKWTPSTDPKVVKYRISWSIAYLDYHYPTSTSIDNPYTKDIRYSSWELKSNYQIDIPGQNTDHFSTAQIKEEGNGESFRFTGIPSPKNFTVRACIDDFNCSEGKTVCGFKDKGACEIIKSASEKPGNQTIGGPPPYASRSKVSNFQYMRTEKAGGMKYMCSPYPIMTQELIPIGIESADGGATTKIHACVPKFSEKVDVYLGYCYRDLSDQNSFCVTLGESGDSSVAKDIASLTKWKANTPGSIEKTFSFSRSDLQKGKYNFIMSATKVNDPTTYHLWKSDDFVVDGAYDNYKPPKICAFSFDKQQQALPPEGGSGNFKVTPIDANCDWDSPSTESKWIKISADKASKTISFKVDKNSGTERDGIIQVGHQQFTVRQKGASAKPRPASCSIDYHLNWFKQEFSTPWDEPDKGILRNLGRVPKRQLKNATFPNYGRYANFYKTALASNDLYDIYVGLPNEMALGYCSTGILVSTKNFCNPDNAWDLYLSNLCKEKPGEPNAPRVDEGSGNCLYGMNHGVISKANKSQTLWGSFHAGGRGGGDEYNFVRPPIKSLGLKKGQPIYIMIVGEDYTCSPVYRKQNNGLMPIE